MKTLTEFSTLMLRKAAQARATVPAAHVPPVASNTASAEAADTTVDEASSEPAAEAQLVAPDAESDAAAATDARSEVAVSSQDADAQAAPSDDSDGAAEPASEASGEPSRDFTSDPAVTAVAAACGVQPDRAVRLLEALDIVGRDIDRVRLVRVYQGEKGPHNAVSRGEFHYVIDRVVGPARDRRNNQGGHGGHSGRDGRDGRDNRDRPSGGGGGPGGSFRGSDRKPRGLGSLKFGAVTESKDQSDERPGRGEMPRAGIGWQLTPSPRTAEDFARGMGRRRPPSGRKPRGPRGAPHGRPTDRDSRNPKSSQPVNRDAAPLPSPRLGPDGQPLPPRLGPDGQPLPPRRKAPRKPLGPDANGLGPDGTPWDPERRAKRMAERASKVNEVRQDTVQTPTDAATPQPPESSK